MKARDILPFHQIIILLLFALQVALAQESLVPYHWAQDYLNYFRSRGWLQELSPIQRPYSRMEIARQLLDEDWENHALSPEENNMLLQLLHEFQPEMKWLVQKEPANSRWKRLLQRLWRKLQSEFTPSETPPAFIAGSFSTIQLNREQKPASRFWGHTQLGILWQKHLLLYQNLSVFNHVDTGYIGKKFRNLYALAEQAYLQYRNPWLYVKIGRDFFQIGPGQSGQLLISDNSRPFDMYFAQLKSSCIAFSFWGFLLNKRPNRQQFTRTVLPYANRFLNGHRLSLNLKHRFYLGLSEVILYGGPQSGWDLGYMNPFIPFYSHLVNGPGIEGNILLNLDFAWYFHPNWNMYGEFLVDDFQVDRKTPGDLEPNELGLLIGLQHAQFLLGRPLLWTIEYVQIRNRTYNAPQNDWEKFLHRNKVIGYYLGNNLEHFFLKSNLWLAKKWQMQLHASLIRQGEGSVQGEFNKDYLQHSVSEGYHEPFPYGIVENHWQWTLQARYYGFSTIWVALELQADFYRNYQHIPNNRFHDTSVWLLVWLNWKQLFTSSSQWLP